MKNVKDAFSRPAYISLPDVNERYLLNNRILRVNSVLMNNQYFPNDGTFSKAIIRLENHIEVRVTENTLIFVQNNHKVWTIFPDTIEIFLEKVNSQNVFISSASRTYGPRYRTILHVMNHDFNLYLRIPGAKCACYLLRHPRGFSILDPTLLSRISYYSDEYKLCDAINTLGYHKLVSQTELAFLDNDNASNVTWN